MRAIPIALVAVLVLFAVAVIAPRTSERLQGWLTRRIESGQETTSRRGGTLGDWTATLLVWGQRLVDAAAGAGRSLRQRLSPGR